MKKIHVGIIGFGLSGSVFHAPLINTVEGFKLTAIASSRSEVIYDQHPEVKVYSSAKELIADQTIDLVVVTAPNAQHFLLTKLALENHKHVVVEKPFVLSTAEGELLIALAKSKGLILSVYHNRRWDNDFMALQQSVQENLLGKIYSCEIRFERFRPTVVLDKWREQNLAGSGVLYDLGSHLIDQALCLFGWPESIYAEIASQRPGAVVNDYFHILLGYGELKVILHASTIVRKPGPRFLVHGSKGSFIKYGFDPQEQMLRATVSKTPLADVNNVLEIILENNGLTSAGNIELPIGNYRAYYQQLYLAMVENAAVPVTATEALNCIKLIDYALLSNAQAKKLFI